MELSPGALIAGRYRVDRKIGAGGMGEVWAGEHVSIGVRVALKTLLPAAALDRQLVARFRREAQLLGRLRSDRVARVVDFVEDQQLGLVLVMDFIEGEVLGAVLQTRRLGIEETVDLGVDIVTALCDLHRVRVVHRDLKPDNIILEPLAGGRRRAVIVDLGVSRLDAGSTGDEAVTSITQVDMAVGTLPYMAPEQLLSSSTATAAADVYAVGAILYRAISGEQVFDDADDALAARRKITADAPPLSLARFDRVAKGLAAVVARALQRRPEDRFETADEMLEALTTLRDLSRASSLDLDAATEEALPPAAMSLISYSSAPSTEASPPPASAGGTPAPPAAARPDPLSEDVPTGEPTRPMSRPPIDPADAEAFYDEETHASPASQALPRADPAAAPPSSAVTSESQLSAPPTISSPRFTRPTVLSPVLAAPGSITASSPIADPATIDEHAPRTIRLTWAVAGFVAALAAGATLGFEIHNLLAPAAPPPAGHAGHSAGHAPPALISPRR